jgi:ketosteroid isomerase-like protein
MSEENVELVRDALQALERRDRTTWIALHDDDVEVVPIRDFPEAGVRGPVAAWDFYLKAFDRFGRVAVEDAGVFDAGADKVLVDQQLDLRGTGSDPDVEFDYWIVVTVRQGRILRAQWFGDRVEAFEAAGMSE